MRHSSRVPSLFLRGAAALLLSCAARASMDRPENLSVSIALDAQPDDPIEASDGAYYFDLPLLQLGGPMDLAFDLHYRSDLSPRQFRVMELPGTPWWWTPKHTGIRTLWDGTNFSFVVQTGRGDVAAFRRTDAPPAERWRLVREDDFAEPGGGSPLNHQLCSTLSDTLYFLDARTECVHIFERAGNTHRIASIMDRHGNRLDYTYSDANGLKPALIADGLGRSLALTYDAATNRLLSVTDQTGRRIGFEYELNAADNGNQTVLRGVTNAAGGVVRFAYQAVPDPWGGFEADNVSAIHRPAGNTPYTQTYTCALFRAENGHQGRVASQSDAHGHTVTFSYDTDTYRVRTEWADGSQADYFHASRGGPPQQVVDAEGRVVGYAKNGNDQVTRVTNRLGGVTSYAYDDNTRERVAVTNPLGQAWNAEYVVVTQAFANPFNAETVSFAFPRVSRVAHADGTEETFQYNAQGSLTASVDRAGALWQYEYNAMGLLTGRTDPEGGRQVFRYDPAGQLAEAGWPGPLGMTHWLYRDQLGRVTGVVNSVGARRVYRYDHEDRVTEEITPMGYTNRFVYDANGNLTAATDEAGRTSHYTYDAMDRLAVVTSRVGAATEFGYDRMGRPATVTDANGVAWSNTYTALGDLESVGYAGGGRWTMGYNAEGIPVSYTAPSGAAWLFGSDGAGRLLFIEDPLGRVTAFGRDAMDRMTAVTDAVGRVTHHLHNARGEMNGISNAVLGAAQIRRDGRGNTTNLTDFGGASWAFTYGPEGLLSGLTDPLGRRETYEYDAAGALFQVERPGLHTLTQHRDADGAVTQLHAEATWDAPMVVLTTAYDRVGRPTVTAEVEVQYDADGRITNTVSAGTGFGARYDAGGRLAGVSYRNGAFAVQYQYDSLNRLTNVSDSASGASVALVYDEDSRPVTLRRANGVDTAWTYDAAGQVRAIRHGALGRMECAYDASGCVTQEVRDLPLSAGAALASGARSLAYDAAGEVASAGYGYDVCGHLTNAPGFALRRDALGRVVEIRTNGAVAAAYTYNGFNAPVERTAGGVTRVEHVNHALGATLMVAEENRTAGTVERYYVWTPGGHLLYMVEGAAVHYFHFDRMGNTVFLTDAGGAVAQSYAYTPYGREVAAKGAVDQPFRFGGAFGVRRLPGPDSLYRMGARCYEAGTGRFLSPESLWPRVFEPGALNPYHFAYSAPTRWADPDGLEPKGGPTLVSEGIRLFGMEGILQTALEGGNVDRQGWVGVFMDMHAAGAGEAVRQFLQQPNLPQRLAEIEARARRKKEQEEKKRQEVERHFRDPKMIAAAKAEAKENNRQMRIRQWNEQEAERKKKQAMRLKLQKQWWDLNAKKAELEAMRRHIQNKLNYMDPYAHTRRARWEDLRDTIVYEISGVEEEQAALREQFKGL